VVLRFLILAAVVVIYIVLGVLYESYIHPLTILSTLPSAGVGALLALEFYRMDFSLVALIGVVLLIGIVKKNAIMMIDFALEAQRGRGASPYDAIYEACLLRFRQSWLRRLPSRRAAHGAQTGTGSELRAIGCRDREGCCFRLTLYTTPVLSRARSSRALDSQRRGVGSHRRAAAGRTMNISGPFIRR
jgi:hypothetical protein